MKIEKVSLSKTIPTGSYMNDKVGAEATLEVGETAEDGLSKLNKLITEWHKSEHPHLYQEVNQIASSNLNVYPDRLQHIAIINLKHEALEIEIDNCASLDQLDELQSKYKGEPLPGKIITQFNNKRQELSK